eukprot:8119086-Alexandrium_andersonii.AAC.1
MASQSASLRKALGTRTRMVAVRPLVAGSFHTGDRNGRGRERREAMAREADAPESGQGDLAVRSLPREPVLRLCIGLGELGKGVQEQQDSV